MRTLRTTAILALMLVTALVASPAKAGKVICNDIFAQATTTWMENPDSELGEVAGLINGAMYMKFVDKEPVDPAAMKPNLVITTKLGTLYLWVDGESSYTPDGFISRKLSTVDAFGTGGYAGAKIDLSLTGSCYYGKGGNYVLTGTICTTLRPPTKR